jgi:hypothetical protein
MAVSRARQPSSSMLSPTRSRASRAAASPAAGATYGRYSRRGRRRADCSHPPASPSASPAPRPSDAPIAAPCQKGVHLAIEPTRSSFFQVLFRGRRATQRSWPAVCGPPAGFVTATAFALENGAPSLVNSSVRTFSSDERGYDPASRFPHFALLPDLQELQELLESP